jgi:hypothetical protein
MEVLGYEFKNVSERKIFEDLFELIEIIETDYFNSQRGN